MHPQLHTMPLVVRSNICAPPKATSRTPSPQSVAPYLLIQEEWKEHGALDGWCSPQLHNLSKRKKRTRLVIINRHIYIRIYASSDYKSPQATRMSGRRTARWRAGARPNSRA